MLFTVESLPVDEKFLLIERDYKMLHYDEEPILFSGITAFSYRVLASLVEEEQDAAGDWFARYFYTIIEPRQYADFLNKKITYLSILQNASNIFIVDNHYKSGQFFAQKTSLGKIPASHLPTAESYCPSSSTKTSLKYLVSLKGKLADDFYAVSSDLSSIQESFSKLLSDSADLIDGFWDKCNVYQSAYVPSSFQMSFDVVPISTPSLFTDYEKVADLYNKVINYCIDNLPVEVESIFDTAGHPVYSKSYNDLKAGIVDLYESSFLAVPLELDENLKVVFHKALYSLEGITKSLGRNYDELNVFNRVSSGENFALGGLDADDRARIEDSVLTLESIENTTVSDSDYRDYEIHIYSLNADSRKGMAIIRSDASTISKPRIKIGGKEGLEGSRYTASLHLNEYVTVRAKGKWIDNRCVYLDIVD